MGTVHSAIPSTLPVHIQGLSLLSENLTAPNLVSVHTGTEADRAANACVMNQARLLHRRVRVRFVPEVYAKFGGKPWNYKRLVKAGITASCPSPEQAQALIDAVLNVVKEFNGKWLEEKPLDISNQSASDPQATGK